MGNASGPVVAEESDRSDCLSEGRGLIRTAFASRGPNRQVPALSTFSWCLRCRDAWSLTSLHCCFPGAQIRKQPFFLVRHRPLIGSALTWSGAKDPAVLLVVPAPCSVLRARRTGEGVRVEIEWHGERAIGHVNVREGGIGNGISARGRVVQHELDILENVGGSSAVGQLALVGGGGAERCGVESRRSESSQQCNEDKSRDEFHEIGDLELLVVLNWKRWFTASLRDRSAEGWSVRREDSS